MTESIALRARAYKKPLLLLLIALLVGVVWWRHSVNAANAGKQHGKGAQVVRATQVVEHDMALYLTALGTVTANNTVTVHSRVDGQLQRLGFSEGQEVKAGQMLAQLDPRPFEVLLTQAQGQLARDQAQLNNAQLDLARYRTLLTQNSISAQQVATQEALVGQYRGTVAADRGAVDSAKLQLSYSRVTAPVSGRVGLKQVDLGNIVHASDTNGVVVITQMQPANVVFAIPEDQLGRVLPALRAGQVLTVEAWDRENLHKLTEGRLLTADNQVDSTTGTVKLKAVFDNRDNALFPNQFVNVRLRTEIRQHARVIPLSAMQRGQPGTFVYLIKPDQSVVLRVIKPGPSEGDQLIVDSGLAVGDQIVLDGVDRLRDGARVTVVSDVPGKPSSHAKQP